MKVNFISLIFLFSVSLIYSQKNNIKTNSRTENPVQSLLGVKAQKTNTKASIDQYKIISIERDTTIVDTSLSIISDYKHNYLRKDLFGLLPFANEGQPYSVLNFGNREYSNFPEMGFFAKHQNYQQVKDIKYYSVATPFTDLYFRTVMEQGQNLNSLLTINTTERFNFSLGYNGLRSLGKYINQLSSNGVFKFTSSYHSKNKNYFLNLHFVAHDLLNGENGGITNIDNFENNSNDFDTRAQFEIFLTDAKSFLKGKRFFVDHLYYLNSPEGNSKFALGHQLNYEHKFFEYNQATISSVVGATTFNLFGDSSLNSNINDQSKYNKFYNKFNVQYINNDLGKFQLFAEDYRYRFYYDRPLVVAPSSIPNFIKDDIITIGGQYDIKLNKLQGKLLYSNAISNHSISNTEVNLKYSLDDKNQVSFRYQNVNKLPDNTYILFQSSYLNYNWKNNFNNEKVNNLEVDMKTKWLHATVQFTSIDDYLYFSNNDVSGKILVTPKQEQNTINYFSIKVAKEFHLGKWALDNTVLLQNVEQESDILNVPTFVTRNTLYYSNYYFNRALFLQSGVTFNYFTKYYANDYNPLISDFFVQNQRKTGDFPMLDLFVNARIRQTRIFLKAEHLNSSLTGYNYFNAPNYPYRDFIVRFGLAWNFFQ